MPDQTASALPETIEYGALNQRHPGRDCAYLNRLWAFYSGGQVLLGNQELLRQVFPRHRREVESVYQERINRAFYIGIAGEIVDFLTATLMSDPVRVGQETEGENELKLAAWYEKWVKNVAPKSAPVMELTEFLRECVLNLMVTRESWVRVDLPKPAEYASRADQEKAGALDAWLVQVPTQCVLDWEDDDSGGLKWVIVHSRETPRAGLAQGRDKIIERWFYYDRERLAEYEISYKKDDTPRENTKVSRVGDTPHRFGTVPLIRKTVPDGLWAMDTLEGMQREHFNKRNALSWGEFQSLLPELYEFIAPDDAPPGVVIGSAREDEDKAKSDPRGQGYIQTRHKDSKAEWVGPPVEPFSEARSSCQELRDEMHRVLHLMALSVTSTASMLGRSAASKAQDQSSTAIVARELGRHLREHAVAILEMVSRARGDTGMRDTWKAQGADQFVVTSVDDVIDRATKVETITIKSPTFHRLHQAGVAETLLADRATPKVMKTIEGELEENVTAEDMRPIEKRTPVNLGKAKGTEEEGGGSEGGAAGGEA